MRYWFFLLAGMIFLSGCENKEMELLQRSYDKLQQEMATLRQQQSGTVDLKRRVDFLTDQMKEVYADIQTTKGEIKVRFFPEAAPFHAMNFILLANGGFYNGSKFHRVISGFMIQGGDPNSKDSNPADDGTGGSLLLLPSEFNQLPHKRGTLSMARAQDPNSGRSQFFIMHRDNPGLNGKYSVFGEVVEGMDVVDAIAAVKTNRSDRPLQDVVINSVRVYKH